MVFHDSSGDRITDKLSISTSVCYGTPLAWHCVVCSQHSWKKWFCLRDPVFLILSEKGLGSRIPLFSNYGSQMIELLQKASQVADYAMSHPWHGIIGQVHCSRLQNCSLHFTIAPLAGLRSFEVDFRSSIRIARTSRDIRGYAPSCDNCCIGQLGLSVFFLRK